MRLLSAFIALLCFLTPALHADVVRDQVLALLMKQRLEGGHFAHKKVDDTLSQKAFEAYLKRLDYGKRILLAEDVTRLSRHQTHIDDQIRSGRLLLSQEGGAILRRRAAEALVMIEEILAKPFDFTTNESFESDPEKRSFLTSRAELYDNWRRVLKFSTLTRYVAMKESKEENADDEGSSLRKLQKIDHIEAPPEDGEESDKKLSAAEMEAKARERTLESFRNLFARIAKQDEHDDLERFFNAVASAYDPHTSYMPPARKEDFDIDMSGSLEGIGARLSATYESIKVEEVIPGSASWKQGDLEKEDEIIKVAQGSEEPVSVVGMRIRDAVRLIRGPKGSEVRLTVKKPNGRIMVVPIIRDVVELKEGFAKGAILEQKSLKKKTGYIYLPRFYRDFKPRSQGGTGRNCTDDVRVLLNDFKKAGVDNVVLDLRSNGGGALEDARLMSGLFIERGPIVQVKSSNGDIEVLRDTDSSVVWDGPVVVMLNAFSASASEILAAALQDYGRAVIVGSSHTHGKGTVQKLIGLDFDPSFYPNYAHVLPLGAIKLTTQKFYRVNGGSTQELGVAADIQLPDQYSYMESGERFQDHFLPWDEVAAVAVKAWGKSLHLKKLKAKSASRVAASPYFAKINETIELLTLRKKKSAYSLNLDVYCKEQEAAEEEAERLVIDEEIPGMAIVKRLTEDEFNESERGGEAQKKEQEREEPSYWTDDLLKDPYLEEALQVISDLQELRG